jgi:hypothetical protein
MTRQILIVVGVALLSAAGFALILGVSWLVLHLVLGVVPYLLASRLHAFESLLPTLFVLVAFVGAACAASTLSWRPRPDQPHPDIPSHP